MNKRMVDLLAAMVEYDAGDPRRIHHLLKVHDLSVAMGLLEGMSAEELEVLEAAALVHDIGIHLSEDKYGVSNGKYQQIEGPGEAAKLLAQLGTFSEEEIQRICYLVGHHHTYTNIDGLDYQILVEADFLVNLYEDQSSLEAVKSVEEKIFRTATGKKFLQNMYLDPRHSN